MEEKGSESVEVGPCEVNRTPDDFIADVLNPRKWKRDRSGTLILIHEACRSACLPRDQ